MAEDGLLDDDFDVDAEGFGDSKSLLQGGTPLRFPPRLKGHNKFIGATSARSLNQQRHIIGETEDSAQTGNPSPLVSNPLSRSSSSTAPVPDWSSLQALNRIIEERVESRVISDDIVVAATNLSRMERRDSSARPMPELSSQQTQELKRIIHERVDSRVSSCKDAPVAAERSSRVGRANPSTLISNPFKKSASFISSPSDWSALQYQELESIIAKRVDSRVVNSEDIIAAAASLSRADREETCVYVKPSLEDLDALSLNNVASFQSQTHLVDASFEKNTMDEVTVTQAPSAPGMFHSTQEVVGDSTFDLCEQIVFRENGALFLTLQDKPSLSIVPDSGLATFRKAEAHHLPRGDVDTDPSDASSFETMLPSAREHTRTTLHTDDSLEDERSEPSDESNSKRLYELGQKEAKILLQSAMNDLPKSKGRLYRNAFCPASESAVNTQPLERIPEAVSQPGLRSLTLRSSDAAMFAALSRPRVKNQVIASFGGASALERPSYVPSSGFAQRNSTGSTGSAVTDLSQRAVPRESSPARDMDLGLRNVTRRTMPGIAKQASDTNSHVHGPGLPRQMVGSDQSMLEEDGQLELETDDGSDTITTQIPVGRPHVMQ